MPAHDELAQVLRATLRVLVIEDEHRYRQVLLEIISDLGCEVRGVGTAHEALALMSDDPPDVIMLDLNLPVMDGLTCLERLRQRGCDMPVIVLTGVGDLKSAQRAIRHGVADFLTKPCHLGQIEAALDRARRQIAGRVPAPAAGDPEMVERTSESGEVRSLATVEREAILDALRRHRGNRSAAARELGISRRTLYNRLEEYRGSGDGCAGEPRG